MSRALRALGVVTAIIACACGPDWDALDPSLAGAECASVDDGDPCTDDSCTGGTPVHRAAPAGTPCGAAGLLCDGGGKCVGCRAASECPGVDDACRTRACEGGTCEIVLAPEGTPAGAQLEGDCQAMVCDGAGAQVSVAADEDVPADPGSCFVAGCAAGAPTVMPRAVGSSCGPAPASLCDGAGECITCQPVATAMWNSVDTPLAVPLGSTASSAIDVSGMPGSLVDVDVHVVLGGDATASEITMVLVSPSGTAVELTSGNGAASTGVFAGTTFDDDAPALRVTEAACSDGVVVPAAIPERNLGLLNGEGADGTWTLEVSDASAAAGDATLLGWSLSIASQPGNVVLTPRWFDGGAPEPVPDDDPAGLSSTIAVSAVPGRVYRARVKVTLKHPQSGDLAFSLLSPAGSSVTLSRENGGSDKDVFAGTTFDDAAPLLVGCQGAGCVTFANNMVVPAAIPEGSLSALVGESAEGPWTLTVSDVNAGGQGLLQAWSLEITPAVCPLSP